MNWKGTLILLGILALSCILLFGMHLQNQQLGTAVSLLEAQTSENASRAQQLQTELSRVRTHIDQQSALISRALGKIVPLPVPDDVEGKLSELETMLSAPSAWPPDRPAVEKHFNDLGLLLDDLPTWIQEEMFPRIVPIRWGLDALWYLRATADDDEARLALLDSLESLQRNQPRGAAPAIARQVAASIVEIEREIREADEATSRETLAAGLSSDATLDEMLAALDILADEGAAESSEQLGQLERSIAFYVFNDSLSQLDTQLTQARALSDETLKLAALSRARDAMIELQLRIASAKLEDPQLEAGLLETTITTNLEAFGDRLAKTLDELQAAAGQRHAHAVREYQVWALEQIKHVRPYDEIQQIELNKIPSTTDRNNPFGSLRQVAVETAQQILREEMVNSLSKIDVGLLDVAVSEWFRKVYSERFDRLNDEEKLALVQAFANSTKLGIGEHP
jgi:hypothetical protein